MFGNTSNPLQGDVLRNMRGVIRLLAIDHHERHAAYGVFMFQCQLAAFNGDTSGLHGRIAGGKARLFQDRVSA